MWISAMGGGVHRRSPCRFRRPGPRRRTARAESRGVAAPTPEDFDPSKLPGPEDVSAKIAQAEDAEEKRKAWLQSPEAIQEREESRLAFADLDSTAARDLLHATFASQLAQLNEDPARVLSDAQILRSSEETSATVKDDGDGLLLESSLPVKSENEEGDLRKVDLSLEETASGFETENALVDVEIPESVEESVEVGEEGVGIKLAGVEGDRLARPFGDENVFASEVLPDTDMLISPIATGVEIFNVLRSEESPETLRFQVQVPTGAELRADGEWGAEIVREGETLTVIREPVAVDAQGNNVPVGLEVEANFLVLTVDHREGDYAMPILLDPILENNENWMYGQNHDALDAGVWGYWNAGSWWFHGSTKCIYECFGPGGTGTRGLYVSLEGQRSYGGSQFGQWAYNAPYNSYISRVTLGTPYVHADHNCPEWQYPQPHNYFGLWSFGWNAWTAFSTNSANQPGGQWTLPQRGDAVVFGLSTGGGISWMPCWRDLYAGGAHVWLDDDNWPSVSSVQNPPTSWINASTPVKVVAQASDAGLGVQNVVINSNGAAPILADPEQCSGTRRDPCLTGHTATFNLSGAYFREGRRAAAVTAYDPTGKTSNAYYFETKMDAGAPEVILDGQLAKETNEAGASEQPAGSGDELSLPVYNLKIEAKDEAPGDTEEDWRSGVRDIEVYLDGVEQSVPWSPTPSCARDCPMTQTYKLELSKLSFAGKHTLSVRTWDFAGNYRDRNIEFEYFPATGMKEEYVMQYFPLPDGSDESEEEHPQRPELAVNVMNGNLVYRDVDVDVEGSAGVDLEVERYYNSQLPTSENSEFGDGWTLAQTPELEPEKPTVAGPPAEAEVLDATGDIEGGVGLPTQTGNAKFDPELQATLTKKESGGYELTDETGESAEAVVFDSTGQAEALLGPGESKVDFEYQAGKLAEIEVSDPATFSADPSELEIPEPQLVTQPTYASAFGSNGFADGQLKSPGDVALDAQGNLWVADKLNHRLQKFDPSGKFLAKVSAGIEPINRPTSIVVAANGDLLVTDSGNRRILRFSSAGAFISKFGSLGTGNGQFSGSGPEGIAVDAAGNIWVSDTYGGRLQKFNSAGAFLQAVGTKGSGSGQLGEPTGLDIAPNGDIWVADRQNNRISIFNSTGAFVSQFGSAGSGDGQFNKPVEVEIDKLGNVWVGDQANNRVQQFDLAGQFKAKFGAIGSGPGQFSFTYPLGIAADSRGNLWITDVNNHRVQQWLVPIEKPAYMASFGTSGSGDGQLSTTADVAVGIEGSLWVADKGNNRIQKFDASGKFLAKFGSAGSGDGQFNRPVAIAIDREGNLLVVDANNNRVQKFAPDGQFLAKFGSYGTGNGQFSTPEGIATDFEGNIWIADSGNGRIQKLGENGEFLAAFGTKGTGTGQLGKPIGIDVDPGSGNLWIGDLQNHRISVFEPDGDFVAQFGSQGSGAGQFNRPSGVAVDVKGNVWVADQSNHRVQRFDLSGNYLGQLGSAGAGEGQFAFPTANTPVGIAADDSGRILVADVNHYKIQRWQLGHYQAPVSKPLDLNDGDPKVEIETEAGLVSEITGAAAGEHAYSHSGDDLTAHAGPEGETKYEYDAAGRMTKVTLPNGTWGQVAYFTDGRVKSVTVDPAGAPPAKKTEFEYQDAPSRRTTVVPSDAPHITYDIGEEGSVFKWWNTDEPPTIEPLTGNLYGSRETANPIAPGVYYLTARAYSPEGIASIDIILDGNQLVDELNCEQAPEIPGLECVNPPPVNEWVMETDENSPGIHYVEVLVTSRTGRSASQRFWVNIPQSPPPSIGAPVPPRFKDIKKFREDYGLEVVFPVANEIKLNERIFNLIGAWYNPNSPAGQVARASMERWGVPLRPEDVAELDYREQLYSANAARIEQWVEQTNPSSFGGYYLDHRAGGIMRIGFLGNQAEQLADLASSLSLEGGSGRLSIYPSPPTAPYVAVRATTEALLGAIDSNPTLRGLVVNIEDDEAGKATRVGTPNVAQVEGILDQTLGANAPVTVEYDSGGGALLAGRYRNSGRMRAGDYINSDFYLQEGIRTGGPCTAGFGAEEPDSGPKPNGRGVSRLFLLTAGHCATKIDTEVWRGEYDGDHPVPYADGGKAEVGRVARTAFRLDGYEGVRTDATAIRIKQGGIVPQGVWGWDGHVLPTEQAGRARIDDSVCYSGAISKTVACGRIVARSLNWHPAGALFGLAGYWVRFPEGKRPKEGDSGAPIWNRRTGASIGLVSAHRPDDYSETLVVPLLHPPNMPANRVPGILHHQSMQPLQLRLGG
jgi:YD repeat-containing protein